MTRRKQETKVWHVDASYKKEDDTYRRNLNVWVFAKTLDDAFKYFREQYPDATIWKIIGERYADNVIVVDDE